MGFGPGDEIDHGASLAPYKQLAAILTARTKRGDWQRDRAIPREQQLVQQYGIGRATIRRASALLVEQGVLSVVPQRGTYVRRSDG
ncbi:winged helix-turn-helix domain-containing protein [Plantactinospora sp. B5E13]|uniref:winged helix-turn-helix domain-containing protein n=1 Tax=Plantactinospora sp. B5E13 TaxID=3153758 RepID=UPI00325D7518